MEPGAEQGVTYDEGDTIDRVLRQEREELAERAAAMGMTSEQQTHLDEHNGIFMVHRLRAKGFSIDAIGAWLEKNGRN